MITLDTIDASLHSIQIKDADGDALAIDASGKIGAIVEDGGGSITVDAVDLDIRDLAFATDSVDVTGSSVSITGDVNVTQGTSPWVVSATDLDIRDLDSAQDSVAAVQSGSWTVSISGDVNVTQGTSPWVVSATDLDIRDLSHTQDSVKIGDGTDFLAINADGSINASFTEAGYGSWQVSASAVTTSESSITAFANRLRVEIQNLGSNDIYIRHATGVTSSNGLKIPKGSSYEQALDAGASIYMVAAAGSSDVRIAQYAA